MKFKKIGSYKNGMIMYARFTGYLDYIQYYCEDGNGYKTPVRAISYLELDMFSKLYQEMNKDFFKENIECDWDIFFKSIEEEN